MSIVGSIFGGLMGANAANSAASVEEQGAQQAQQEEKQNQTNALNAQETALGNVTTAEQPYQTLGSTSANNLTALLAKGFQAPTLAQVENTPGYQFTLQQGTNAINQNAAANGTLLSGNTGKALEDYGQGLASTTYQQDYQNALNTYMTNYQSLLGGTSMGENSTAQLAGANLTTAGNTANIDMTAAQQQALQLNNAAAARAGGILGSNAALTNAFGGMASGFSNMDTSGGSSPLEMMGEFAGML